jgi:epoxyqueuosine reductase
MTLDSQLHLDRYAVAAQIKQRARDAGFDLVGVASAAPSRWGNYLRTWLDEGQAGEMAYLANRFDQRTQPQAYLPGAQSVVCVAINYHVELEPLSDDQRPHRGKIARYALGDDYHELLKSRLHTVADWMRHTFPDCQTRACVIRPQ